MKICCLRCYIPENGNNLLIFDNLNIFVIQKNGMEIRKFGIYTLESQAGNKKLIRLETLKVSIKNKGI